MRRAALGCLVAKVAAFPWQGTFPELMIDANDTVAAVTETLYALADETEPLTAAQFVASTGEFLGGPSFTKMGPHVLSVLRRHGLVDASRVLEVGFGVGRVGRSIIDALAPDRFCGIEPNAQMLAAGVSRLIGKDRLRDKRPRFHLSPDGQFEVFGGRFDFVYSRSVWTHMSKRQIELYLDGYLRVSHDDTILLTTYFDAPCGSDYEGDAWVGNSHESDGAGIARHCLPWIERVCAERGLAAADLGRGLGQTWLRIMNASTELLRWPRRDPTVGALPMCKRAPPDDVLLRAWRAALADLPEDTSARPQPRTPRAPNQPGQGYCPRPKQKPTPTPYDALLKEWRDVLVAAVPKDMCKPKSLPPTPKPKPFADQMRRTRQLEAKAALYARGARIRNGATGGR